MNTNTDIRELYQAGVRKRKQRRREVVRDIVDVVLGLAIVWLVIAWR